MQTHRLALIEKEQTIARNIRNRFQVEDLHVLAGHGQDVVAAADVRCERNVVHRIGDCSYRLGLGPFAVATDAVLEQKHFAAELR